MPLILQDAHHITLYAEISTLFSDISFFEELVAESLKQAIIDCDHITLNFITVKNFTERYFSIREYRSNDDKETYRQINTIFQTLCVLIVSKKLEVAEQYFHDISELKKYFPELSILSDDEKVLLLKFRNMVMACLSVIEARLNKQTIIDICGRLEGTQRRYITGKGQRDAVTRRVKIYETEGSITPEVRLYRRLQGQSSGSTSPASSSSSESSDSPKNKKRKTFFEAPKGPKKVKKQEKLRPGRIPTIEMERHHARDKVRTPTPIVETEGFPSSLPSHPSSYYDLSEAEWGSLSFNPALCVPPSTHAFVNCCAPAQVAPAAALPVTEADRHTGLAQVALDVSTGDYESLQGLGISFSDMTWCQNTFASSQPTW